MIRPYTIADFEMIQEWWGKPLTLDTIPVYGTFIAESDGIPLLSVTIYLTTGKGLALLENLVGNPAFKGEKRRELAKELAFHVEQWARERDVKKLICLAPNEKLEKRYQELGASIIMKNISCLAKEI